MDFGTLTNEIIKETAILYDILNPARDRAGRAQVNGLKSPLQAT